MEKLVVFFGKFYLNFKSRVVKSKLNFVSEIYRLFIEFIHTCKMSFISITFFVQCIFFKKSVIETLLLVDFSINSMGYLFSLVNVFIMRTNDCYDVETN